MRKENNFGVFSGYILETRVNGQQELWGVIKLSIEMNDRRFMVI
jgi:hypothetical protein